MQKPLIAFLLFTSFLSSGCDEIRARGAAGTTAGLSCQQENIQRVVEETGALMRAFILSTISGDGKPDTAALRAAAASLKSDGLRCAFVAAVAALTAPPPTRPDGGQAPMAAGLELDRDALRAATRDIARTEWGVTSIQTAPGGPL